jgi:two-component system, chemotaxis family, chemotaxis protein CheY
MSKQMNILIVDDAEYTRTMTLSMLHAINIHNITEADNGETALYILKTKEVDLVLLDVVMPGISGIEVLKEVRADSKIASKKVILVTAAADAKTILLARRQATRADAIIVKPFSVTTLKEKIDFVMKDYEFKADVAVAWIKQ